MQTQFYRRKCDFCDTQQDFPVGGITPALEDEMANWITLAREFIVQGQPFPVVKHACRESCAANLISTGQMCLPENVQKVKDGTPVIPIRPDAAAPGGTA